MALMESLDSLLLQNVDVNKGRVTVANNTAAYSSSPIHSKIPPSYGSLPSSSLFVIKKVTTFYFFVNL